MKIQFTKMHGAGNDFVMIDGRSAELFPAEKSPSEVIAGIAKRPNGIGCEGVIVVEDSARGWCDFKMRFFNPDGSEAELCGNGARCVAAFAKAIGAVRGNKMHFETLAGDIDAEILSPDSVKVRMPTPKNLREDFVNSGVPHRIVRVEDLEGTDVENEGRKIRFSEEFAPAGTNVDFVKILDARRLAMRTYERGVEAESGACGTGATAAAVVGVAQHGMSFPVEVTTGGGYTLTVDGVRNERGGFESVTLTGPVATVFSGVIEI